MSLVRPLTSTVIRVFPRPALTASRTLNNRLFSSTRITMAPINSISDAIKHDHRELEDYYDKIITAKDADTRTRYQNMFTWELARHSIGEELVVYPAFEKHLPDGKAVADKDRDEHQIVKEKLKIFQDMKEDDPEFIPTIKSLMEDLAQHIKEEENDDFPKLEKVLDMAESQSIARSFGRTKMFVPSRSHPSAPNKPPFETLAGLLAAPIDHLGDLFRKFPDEAPGPRVAGPNPSKK